MIPSPVNCHGPAVALHHRRRALDQLGHDLAQPLRTHRRRDVHRVHDIGEQHRDLLVLRRLGGLCDRRAALTTELGCRAQLRAARPTGKARGCQCAATVPTVIHVSIVSPLVRHVCHIAPGMQPARLHQTDEPPSAAFTICTPIDAWLRRVIPSSCRRSERPTRVRDFRASSGLPHDDRGHVIASAIAMCPSKPSDVASAR